MHLIHIFKNQLLSCPAPLSGRSAGTWVGTSRPRRRTQAERPAAGRRRERCTVSWFCSERASRRSRQAGLGLRSRKAFLPGLATWPPPPPVTQTGAVHTGTLPNHRHWDLEQCRIRSRGRGCARSTVQSALSDRPGLGRRGGPLGTCPARPQVSGALGSHLPEPRRRGEGDRERGREMVSAPARAEIQRGWLEPAGGGRGVLNIAIH